MNSIYSSSGLRQPQAGTASRQVQDWSRGLERHTGRQREVIDEKRIGLPAFTAESVLRGILTAVLILLVIVLLADLAAVHDSGDRIGRLSAGIESLEGTNSTLRQKLSLALNHPVLRRKAEGAEPANERTVILSADSAEPEE